MRPDREDGDAAPPDESIARPDPDRVGSQQFTIALVVTALVAAAVWVVAVVALPALGLRAASGLHFLSFYATADNLRPEPLEQQRYLVALLATLVLPGFIALAASRPSLRRRSPASAAIALQLAAIGLVVVAWLSDPRALERFLPATRDQRLLACIAIAVGIVLARRRLVAWTNVEGRSWEAVGWLVALLATGMLCLAGFYFDDNVLTATSATGYHFPYTFEEVYAVAGGHTPLVDWTPQYTALLPYLLAPLLKLSGYSIGAFTMVMVGMSTVALMMGYAALRLLTGRPLRALVLYLPTLAVGLVPVFLEGDQAHTIATYFGVMPLRYAGPLACLAAVAAFARFGSGRRREFALLGLLLGATVLNNVEFGLPAAVATIAAAILCNAQRKPLRLRPRSILRPLVWVGSGAAGVVAAFLALTYVRSGELPDFAQLVYFSRQFAAAGFYMLPIDTIVGLPGIIFLTFVSAVALGAAPVLLGHRGEDRRSRVRTAVLVYTGIFGLGVYGYWVGRSDDAVLAATFLAWALALAALAFEGLRFARAATSWRAPGAPLYALAVVLFALVGLAGLRQATYGFDQPKRSLRHDGDVPIAAQGAVVSFARACLAPGTDVGLFVPFGLRVADAANVRDWFPYSNPTAVVTREQIDHVFGVLADHDVELVVTGVALVEFTEAMRSRGFRKLATGPNPVTIGVAPVDTGPVLELWGTAARAGVRCPLTARLRRRGADSTVR